MLQPPAKAVPPEKRVAFLVDPWAPATSDLVGFVGGIVVRIRVRRSRSAEVQ